MITEAVRAAVIVTQQELMEATGYRQRRALERYLRSEKIAFYLGRNKTIWTTVDALNASLGIIRDTRVNPDDLEFA